METYYYEIEDVFGGPMSKEFSSDQEAIKELTQHPSLEIIYKESDTPDGTPFITVWEKK